MHLEPIAGGYEVRFRIDGVLQSAEKMPEDAGRSAVLRLMVMAQLLTYRLDIPQEGRVRLMVPGAAGEKRAVDLRLAIMPAVHGLRAVVRLPAELTQPRGLLELGLPAGCVGAARGLRGRMRGCCW